MAREARALVEAEASRRWRSRFLHAYRDPRHEQRAGEIVRALYPDLPLTLSSEVAPEIREYERTSTACANAYVQPLHAPLPRPAGGGPCRASASLGGST